MIGMNDKTRHDNISQRVVSSYLRGIGATADVENEPRARRDLREFLKTLYGYIYGHPAYFGLPAAADDCLANEAEGKERKQEVTKRLQKPREIMEFLLGLLREFGRHGRPAGEDLVIGCAEYGALLAEKTKVKRAALAGLGGAGLAIAEEERGAVLRCERFPRMMPALKELAEACDKIEDDALAAFNFARCDFRAPEPGYCPEAATLFGFFAPDDRARAARLHSLLSAAGYQDIRRVYGMHAWEIQYQGPRKIKSSPLLRLEYSERHACPLQVDLKCASVDRLLPFLAEQPRDIQDDFHGRTYPCRGSACGWCKSRKGLGPSVVEREGEAKTVCWYTKSEVEPMDDEAVRIVEGYIEWHKRLA